MRLSLQLYTVRNELAADTQGTLEKVAETGYKYIETGYHAGREADDWRRMLDGLSLKVSGMHVGIEALESDLLGVQQSAATLSCPYVILPWIAEERRSDWRGLGAKLEGIAKQLAEVGLPLAYHNHDFEFKDGGMETLFESTSPDLVKSELDVAWVAIGGGDPVAWIDRLSDRLPLVHLKDYKPGANPIWRPAGEGVIDWDGVLEACRKAGVKFGAVELDESPGSPLDAIRTSYDFFASKGVS